jgi:hypothetical protein
LIQVGLKTELCELAEKWGTDKYLYYTAFYHHLLRDYRNAKKVLELGIGYPALMLDSLSRVHRTDYITGASLYMWEEYFPDAEIYALDNRKDILFNKGRIHSFYCEQENPSRYPQLGTDFDFIIEDGSHIKEHQLTAIEMLVPLLRPGGIYIAEDCGYMTRRERAEFANLVPYPCEIHEFHNPQFGGHIAAVVVIRA